MKNWKYLTFAGLMMLGIAGGAVACGDSGAGGSGGSGPPSCTQPSDCDSGACDTKCSVCIGTTCDATHPCTDTTKECRAACAGGATQCLDPVGGGGSGGSGGTGGNTCANNGDCYSQVGYCATNDTCVSFACGTQYNMCSGCGNGPAGGDVATNGPVIYRLDADQQVDLDNDANIHCRKSVAACGAQQNVCKFHGYYIPAAGQTVSSTGAYRKIYLTSSTSCTSDTDCGGSDAGKCVEGKCGKLSFENVSLSNGEFTFEGCFDATTTNPAPSAFILDDAGNHSNSLCFSGVAP
jgi:hypothetical protein